MSFAMRLSDGEPEAVDLSRKVRQALGDEAALRAMSRPALVAALLEAIVDGDQFDVVLRRGEAGHA